MTTKPKKRMRLGLSISAAGIAFLLVLFACSQPDQNITEISEVKDISMMDDVYENVEIMPEYPGGMESLITFLGTNISYPDEAKEKGIEGKVFVGFIIDKEGSVREVKAKNKIGYGCEEEAVRVISLMPDWKPGYLDGKAVNVSYTIPISFALDSKKEKDSVFTVVKQMPEFPGGVDALMQYLGANIKYPEQAKKDSIQGRVFVSFVVEKDGKVDEVKVLRGIGSGCDKESVRVISTMPDWTPGRNENGEAVRVAYNIPIKFALN